MVGVRYALLSLLVWPLSTAGYAADLQSTLDTARRLVAQLQSMEYSAESQSEYGDISVTHQVFYAFKADLYRCDTKLTNNKGAVLESVYAYDRSRYQHLDRDSDRLSYSTRHSIAPNSTGGPEGLTLAYMFLFFPSESEKRLDRPTISWAAVRDPKTWEGIGRFGSVARTSVNDAGEELVVVSLQTFNEHAVRIEVEFDLGKAGFPIRTRLFGHDGEVVGESTSSDFVTFEGDGASVAVPLNLHVENRAHGKAPGLRMDWKIRPESLKVNREIEDSIFTLSTVSVGKVVDLDEWEDTAEQRKRAEDERLGNIQRVVPRSNWRLLTFNAGAVVLVVAVLVYRRWRGRRK